MADLRLILGGPGTGKTTRLLSIVEKELERGVLPQRIAFVSFTRRAANEAASRAMDRFRLTREELPHFRTLHSMAYRSLGLKKSDVMALANYRELGDLLGIEMTGKAATDDECPARVGPQGDRLNFIEGYARARKIHLEEAHHTVGDEVDWRALEQYRAALEAYKRDTGLIDFTDMLNRYLKQGDPEPVDVAVVDEAQDLSTIQWDVVSHAFSTATRIYIAGDDDQAIYRWSGADVDQFLSIESNTREVLRLSHRLPRRVHGFASGIVSRIVRRFDKVWSPRDADGDVIHHLTPEQVDLSEGTWLLLARNGYLLGRLERTAREQSVLYTTRRGSSVDPGDVRSILAWQSLLKGGDVSASEATGILSRMVGRKVPKLEEDARLNMAAMRMYGVTTSSVWYESLDGIPQSTRDYYRAALRRGEVLQKAPRVHIDTVHGVKGAEADNVLLMTDYSAKTEQGAQRHPDDEHRVFYVGATRARKTLHVVAPQTTRYYRL